ncbi:hypothetical protein LCGC14_1006320 [marine sediment metagenome]|uniref:Uncharacterized protein n=1 Tax=marine sediment metagenome TaxID=412755 RepID=A0A0F9R7N7_9ZZZZ
MARAMRFLEGWNPVVVIFASVKFRGRRDMTADGTYDFFLPLNLELLKCLPKPVVEAYAAMEKPGGQIEASFDHRIEHRTLEFRVAPDGSIQHTFHNVNLGKFYLEKVTKGTGSDISLHFSFELPLDDESGRFFRENFPHQIWLSVSATQPELIPQEKE